MTNNSVKPVSTVSVWLTAIMLIGFIGAFSFVIWDDARHSRCYVNAKPVGWPHAGEIWIELDESADLKGDICVWMFNAELREWEALGGLLCPKEVSK